MENKNKSDNNDGSYLSVGVCLGMSIGVALGVVMDNISMYLPIGMCVGMCIGILMDSKKKKETEDDSQAEE